MQAPCTASGAQRRRSQRIAEKQLMTESSGCGSTSGAVGCANNSSRPTVSERAYKRRSEVMHVQQSCFETLEESGSSFKYAADPLHASVSVTSATGKHGEPGSWLSTAGRWNLNSNTGTSTVAPRLGFVQADSPTPRSCRDVPASATRSSGYFSLVDSASCSSSLQAATVAATRERVGYSHAPRPLQSAGDVVDGCVCPSAGLLSLSATTSNSNIDTNNNYPRPQATGDKLLVTPFNGPQSEVRECPAALRAFVQLSAQSNASPIGELMTTWRALRDLDVAHGAARRSLLLNGSNGNPLGLLALRSDVLAVLNEEAARSHVLRETFYLAADYLDRYVAALQLSERVMLASAPHQLRLLAAACLLVAAKLEEIYPPKVEQIANGLQLNSSDVLNGEILVCTRLGWCLEPIATPLRWLLLYVNACATYTRVQSACTAMSMQAPTRAQVRAARTECNKLLLVAQIDKGALMEMCALLDAVMLDGGSLRFSAAQLAAGVLSFYCGDLLNVCTGFSRSQLAACIAFLLPFMYVAYFVNTGRMTVAPLPRRMSLPATRHSTSVTLTDLLNEFDLEAVATNGETLLEQTGAMRSASVEIGPKCASSTGGSSVVPVRVLNIRLEVRAASLFAPDEAHLVHLCVAPKAILSEAHQIRTLMLQVAAQRRVEATCIRLPRAVRAPPTSGTDEIASRRRRPETATRGRKRVSMCMGEPSQAIRTAALALAEASAAAKRSRTSAAATATATDAPATKRRRSCKPKLAA